MATTWVEETLRSPSPGCEVKDVAAYLLLGFRKAHELSEAVLDFEQRPNIRRHSAHAAALADDAVSALAHAATAAADLESDIASTRYSLSEARDAVVRVKRQLWRLTVLHFATADEVQGLIDHCEETLAVLLAASALLRADGRRAA